MPKKPSTTLTMQAYPPLSSRRWHALRVDDVCRTSKANVRFFLSVLDEPEQAGRAIEHELPAILAPNSPLSEFLQRGFGIQLAENKSFDLADLVGRCLEARFTKAALGSEPAIVAVKRIPDSKPAMTIKRTGANAEPTHGLG